MFQCFFFIKIAIVWERYPEKKSGHSKLKVKKCFKKSPENTAKPIKCNISMRVNDSSTKNMHTHLKRAHSVILEKS